MKLVVLPLLLGATVGVHSRSRRMFDFESHPSGQELVGFVFALTGSGRPGGQSVRSDDASRERGL
jgi:hypothetical protein